MLLKKKKKVKPQDVSAFTNIGTNFFLVSTHKSYISSSLRPLSCQGNGCDSWLIPNTTAQNLLADRDEDSTKVLDNASKCILS